VGGLEFVLVHVGESGVGFEQEISRISPGEIDIGTQLFEDMVPIHVILPYAFVFGLDAPENGKGVEAGECEKEQKTAKPQEKKPASSTTALHS
jgi:hypothetical protein